MLQKQLADEGLLNGELFWHEDVESPYFTDKPNWDGYGALLKLACYSEHPELAKPESNATEWMEDPAYQRSLSENFKMQYPHLLNCELWFPCNIRHPFRADLFGNDISIGSSIYLLEELQQLNKLTYNLQGISCDAPNDDDSNFDSAARFGLSVFLNLAYESVTNKLPFKLDY